VSIDVSAGPLRLEDLRSLSVRAECEVLGTGPDPYELARALRDEPGLVCLSGSWAGGATIIASRPLFRLGPASSAVAALDVRPELVGQDRRCRIGGGWFGWLSYETGRQAQGVRSGQGAPLVGADSMAFYDHLLRHDPGSGDWYFESLTSGARAGTIERRRAALRALLAGGVRPAASPYRLRLRTPSSDRHLEAVETAVIRIRAGELFQANICTRLTGTFTGSAVDFWADSADRLRPAYSAFVQGEIGTVASLSPELYLRRHGRSVRSAPIKGTRPRHGRATDGEAEQLRTSVKDVAENVMIVDLVRNDLGRVCRPGTVRVPGLVSLESHPGVWHLVSRVEGELRPSVTDAELIAATFPPGSVTGAPKVRAMQLIDELEGTARGVYTGAVGFVSPIAGLELNVAIRTFELAGGRAELGVGGGITLGSVPVLEWRECAVKARPLLALAQPPGADFFAGPGLSSVPPEPMPVQEDVLVLGGRPVRLADHLDQLDRSCRELYGQPLPDVVEAAAIASAATAPSRRALLSVVVGIDGGVLAWRCRTRTAPEPTPTIRLTEVARPTGSWRHRWAIGKAAQPGGSVPLYRDADGSMLETAAGSLFVVGPGGRLVTPPLTDQVLPAVARTAVLDAAMDHHLEVSIRRIHRAELLRSAAFTVSTAAGISVVTAVNEDSLRRADDRVSSLRDAVFPPAIHH
jgi:anthranilate/para-aminobenzoate synthase component I/branched-subunit amino acid aminotransferase/4-amino-4-deoxychorismate lyase